MRIHGGPTVRDSVPYLAEFWPATYRRTHQTQATGLRFQMFTRWATKQGDLKQANSIGIPPIYPFRKTDPLKSASSLVESAG